MYRFALRPRWLLSHLFVLALVVLMVSLGFWQLRRLDERRTTNEAVAARAEVAPVPVDDLVDVDDDVSVGEDLAWRRVVAEGTWRTDDEVVVRNRTLDEQPGLWVLTPLELASGDVAIVNRGWVPLVVGERGAPVDGAAPPDGPVTVEALVQPTQRRGSIGPKDPADGTLDVLSRADVERLAAQLDQPVLPVLLQLADQDPAPAADLPVVLPLPEQGEGPHLSYAVQWFTFSTIAVLGYPLVLWRVAHGRSRAAPRAPTADAT